MKLPAIIINEKQGSATLILRNGEVHCSVRNAVCAINTSKNGKCISVDAPSVALFIAHYAPCVEDEDYDTIMDAGI